MSYTLRGRLESRLAAALLPFLAAWGLALAEKEWWPVELASLMIGVGIALDVAAYHRLLPYQAGWLAVPLGALELGAIMGLVFAFDVAAPLDVALAFFAGSWLLTQVLAHAGFPLAHLTYAEDGGELGRAGRALLLAAPAAVAAALGVAWATQPPTVHLAAGVHQGPLLIDHSQKLVGEPGAVVRGGIRITTSDVTVRGVTVIGGEHGIEVDGARNVRIEDVSITRSTLDGINVRRSTVKIRDCRIAFLVGEYTQGIDISFGFDLGPSRVERCHVIGTREGIVSHFSLVDLRDNRVEGARLRGITVTEMSMGSVEDNLVEGATGVGIFCGDYSECEIEDNHVVGTRPDRASDDGTRAGYAIQAHYGATAHVGGNTFAGNRYDVGSFSEAEIRRE